jgi:FdhD protein
VGRVTARTPTLRVDVERGSTVQRADSVAVEEPLEMRVGGVALTATMRTPGDDFDLVLGHLVTEGLLESAAQVHSLVHCQDAGEDGRPTFNVVDVTLAPGVVLPPTGAARSTYTSSACGVCGKSSIAAISTRSRHAVDTDPVRLRPGTLAAMPDTLRAAQRVFERTGGLHAAGVFTPDGELLAVREDVGRHNAVDKLVGWAAREDRLPLSGCVLLVSGRTSFELAQKALMAGVPVLASVSAPSSLAVELAENAGMTLVGFLRGTTMNAYARPDRLAG